MKASHVSFELTMGGKIDKLEVDLQDVMVVTLDRDISVPVEQEFNRKIRSLFGFEQDIILKTRDPKEHEGQTHLF